MNSAQDTQRSGMSLTALSPEDLAKLLSKASGKALSVEMLARHIANGAPVNADGTINLIYYAAWLAKGAASSA